MPLYAVTCRDKPDGFDLRARTREAHLAWLAEHEATVRLGGPLMDGEGRSTGSLLIVEAPDLAAATRWAAQDPYAAAGVFASTTVEPWRVVVGGFGPRTG